MNRAIHHSLIKGVKEFLRERFVPGLPLLLGCSGGPDSKSLLYLILECQRFYPIDLHIAHVNHSWREESFLEAETLEKECQSLGLNWHLATFSPSDFSLGNLEEQGRIKRLCFFKEVYEKIGSQALLLGHQAEDQAEVVLKRVFEGAHLYALTGLTSESQVNEMKIWRPLLEVSKKKLLSWLEDRGYSYFIDPTNESSLFLRGKMRQTMLPFLAESFGKQIAKNLCFLAEEAHQLKEYFLTINRSVLQEIEKSEEDLDFSGYLPMHPLQLQFLMKEWLRRKEIVVSRQILTGIVDSLLYGKGKRVYKTKSTSFFISGKKIKFISNKIHI